MNDYKNGNVHISTPCLLHMVYNQLLLDINFNQGDIHGWSCKYNSPFSQLFL